MPSGILNVVRFVGQFIGKLVQRQNRFADVQRARSERARSTGTLSHGAKSGDTCALAHAESLCHSWRSAGHANILPMKTARASPTTRPISPARCESSSRSKPGRRTCLLSALSAAGALSVCSTRIRRWKSGLRGWRACAWVKNNRTTPWR